MCFDNTWTTTDAGIEVTFREKLPPDTGVAIEGTMRFGPGGEMIREVEYRYVAAGRKVATGHIWFTTARFDARPYPVVARRLIALHAPEGGRVISSEDERFSYSGIRRTWGARSP
jgi:hypothetical protein